MTQITINDGAPEAETPTKQAMNSAQKTLSFTDSMGRDIVLKKLMPYEVYNFDKMIGDQSEKSYQWLLTAFHVVSVGGEQIARGSLLQLEATIQRLGDSFDDAFARVMILNGERMKKNQALMEMVKNELGTPE
jgi:hypothetical protein